MCTVSIKRVKFCIAKQLSDIVVQSLTYTTSQWSILLKTMPLVTAL